VKVILRDKRRFLPERFWPYLGLELSATRTTVGLLSDIRVASRSLMFLALKPARPASSSCVRPAASLSRLSRTPNGESCPRLTSRVRFFVMNLIAFPWLRAMVAEGASGRCSASLPQSKCGSSAGVVRMVYACAGEQTDIRNEGSASGRKSEGGRARTPRGKRRALD
jgi:hypothetical protein